MSPRSSQLERGFVVGGYRIDELISRGGMGVVYRATNVALNRIYALKVLAPELADDDQFRERFKREMRVAASLHHPNVVGIHYAGEHDGLLFLVMDFVHGTDLRELLRKSGALDPDRAVDLLVQLASALDAAHGKGLVHRDVKPANVLITVRDGEEHAYLTDFGVAKRSDTVGALTQKGVVVGTVDYMSPEQITGGATDARTDIYALGCVFFQMLTGNVPYERENSVATLFAHVHEPPPPLGGELADSYPGFGAVIDEAMAKEPAGRYLSAGDFARAAAAALRGMRYTEPSTVVGTGEAQPLDGPEPGAPRTAESEPGFGTEPAAPTAPPRPEAPQPDERTELGFGTEPAAPTAPPRPEAPQPDEQPVIAASERTEPAAALGGPTRIVSGVSEPPAAPQTWPPAEPPTGPPAGPPTWAPAEPPAGPPTSSVEGGERHPPPRSPNRYRWRALALLLLVGAAAAAVIVLTSGSSSPTAPVGQRFAAAASPVPTNRVTGSGSATVALQGNVATVTLTTSGLLNGASHLLHIHAGGLGQCPPASAARLHNGHLAISTGNGIKFYGPPEVALTETGDTSAKSNLAFPRFPSVGTISYKRVVTVTPLIASLIRGGNAVIVVHGIDYDHSGTYDEALGRSDLAPQFTGDSTAPALCGSLASSQTAATTQRPRGTIYTASLTPYITSQSDPAAAFSFLCHVLATEARTTSGLPASGID
jgi:serine/threonine protein kinase